MSDASTKQAVECPICGDEFDPTVAGGWCTNTECGEWQYTENSSDADETVADVGESSTEDPSDDGFVSASEDEAPEPDAVDLFGEEDETAAAGEGGAVEPEAADDTDDDQAADVADDAGDLDVDDETEDLDGDDGDGETERIACPDCGVDLDADANFCVECGADVSEVAPDESELDACPGCGTEVEPADNFCVNCGEDLEAHLAGDGDEDTADAPEDSADDGGLPDSLVLVVEGREIHVDDGDTVGREIRAALTDAGRPDDEAVRIHREHVRFVRESGSFYLLDLGDNPTQLNGQRLRKGDREPVAPGDELELSGVASVTVRTP